MGIFSLGEKKETEESRSRPEESGAGSSPSMNDDPLREKIHAFESGVDPEEAAKVEVDEEEAARRDREAKANFITNMVMGAVGFLSREAAALRGDHCLLSEGEVKKLDDAVYPVSLKYVEKIGIPAWIDRYKEELTLAYVVSVICFSKYRIDQKIQAERRRAAEEAGGEVGETGL